MKNILYLLFFIVVSYKATAQITYIPDPAFELQLIYVNIDSDGIVNGQVLTSDVESVTSLLIDSDVSIVSDLTGIQDFISLESLVIYFYSNITELDISQNTQLKILHVSQSLLTELDLSNNGLLEELYCGNPHDDVSPQNEITYIDLSNNPNIHTVSAENMFALLNGSVNLMNGNNNENMYINVQRSGWDWTDETPICIQVDNPENAINGNFPYSEWNIIGAYHFSGEECSLSTQSFTQSNIKIYPNPVFDILYFGTDTAIEKVIVFDISGRKVLEQNEVSNISVSDLQKGSYILKLFTDKGVQTDKILVK